MEGVEPAHAPVGDHGVDVVGGRHVVRRFEQRSRAPTTSKYLAISSGGEADTKRPHMRRTVPPAGGRPGAGFALDTWGNMVSVKRTITGRTSSRTMSLGDLRQFIGSLDGLPDEAEVKAKVTLRKHLRSVTVEEDDGGFRDFVRAVEQGGDTPAESRKARSAKQQPRESSAV